MTRDDPLVTPKEVRQGMWRWLPTALLVLVVVLLVGGGITYAGSRFGWWLGAQNAKHQTQITENGLGYQTAKTDDLNAQIANVLNLTTSMIGTSGSEYEALHAQRLGDARLACADASQITTIPADQQGWVTANCQDGTLNPASPLLATQGS
jgi:hypothetical protein